MQICKVPIQTLVNRNTAHLHFYYFDYFLYLALGPHVDLQDDKRPRYAR